MPDSLLDQLRLQPSSGWHDGLPPPAARRPGLRLHLAGLVLAALLPALAAGVAAVWNGAEAYRGASEARLRDTARALALAIDVDIAGRVEALSAYAASPAFGDGTVIADFAAAHLHARRVSLATGMRIAVGDADGRFLLHFQVPLGEPLPETGVAGAVLREAVAQARPVVSNLMPGPVVDRSVVAVVVPVPRADGGPPRLSAGGSLDPERFDALLAAQGLEAGTFAQLTDASGVILARSDGRRRGEMLPEGQSRLQATADGLFRHADMDGEERLFAFARLRAVPGWTVTLAAPYAAYRESWRRPLLEMAAGMALALLAGGTLSLLLARRLLMPLRQLAGHARAIALDPEAHRTTAADLPPASVAELEALRRGFAAAETALQRRTAAERRAYATLAEKEAMLAGAQQLTGVGGWTWDVGDPVDLDANPLRWTEETYRIFGHPPGTVPVSGALFFAAIPPEDHARVRAALTEALRDRRPYRLEHRIRRPDGSVRIVEELASPELDSQGHIWRVVGSCQDVTERRMTATALADNAARLHDLLETLHLATVMARDPDGTIRFWSAGCERLFGWTAAEAMGRISHDLLGTVFPVPHHEIEAALARDGEWRGELRHRRRDGEEVVVAAHKALRRDAAGRPLAVVESVADVTALHEVQAALAESEARLRLALEGTGLGIWEQDFGRNRVRLDAHASAIIGGLLPAGVWLSYDGDDFARWRAAVHPEDRDRRETSRREMMAGVGGVMAVEFRIGLGAAWRWIAFRSTAADRDSVGRPSRVLSVIRDVTEARDAEQALRDSEARLRSVVDTALDAIVVAMVDGTIVSANPAAARMFGHAGPEALVGRDLGMLMPADEAARHPARLAALAASSDGAARSMAPGRGLMGRRADGSEFPLEVSVAGFAANGHRFVTGILRDVTEREAAARMTAESEALYRATFEHAAVGMAQVSLDGRWLQVNDRLCAITGFSREEMLEHKVWDITHPEDRADGLDLMHALQAGHGGTYARVKRYLRKDGRTVTVNLSVSVLQDAAGRPQRIISVIEDISARLQAEAALAASEVEFRATFEQAAVGIAHVSLDGRWLKVNDRLCAITGYPREELLALSFQDITHPDDLETDLEQLRALLAGETNNYSMEKRYRRKDGAHVWANLTVAVLRDAEGHPTRLISAIEDISSRKAAEAAQAESEQRYRTLFESMEEGFALWEAIRAPNGQVVDFRLLERNEAVDRITHRLPDAAVGQTLRTLFPEIAAASVVDYGRAVETGTPMAIEYQAAWIGRWLSKRIYRPAPDRVAVLVRDVTDRVAAEAAIRDSEAMLRRVMDNLFTFVGVLAPDGTLLDANRAPLEAAGITIDDVRGRPFWEAYWWSHDTAVRAQVHAACERAAAGETSRFDIEVRMAGDSRLDIDFQVAPLLDAAGNVTHLIPSAVDITERKRTEEVQTLLAREVDHRAKNALAVVQAVLTLTRTADPAAFKKAVMGRIAAMSRAHTLLARERWNGADLRIMLEEELEAYLGGGGLEAAVRLDGPQVGLVPDAAQPVAMAVHELATNAAKYGALSVPGGRVEISWSRELATGGLTLLWCERGGPPVAGPPARRGFGTSLVENTVVRQMRGGLDMRWEADGLVCALDLPPKQVLWRTGPQPRPGSESHD